MNEWKPVKNLTRLISYRLITFIGFILFFSPVAQSKSLDINDITDSIALSDFTT